MAKKLMIVDGHAGSRQMVRQAVAAPQDTVLECTSADEALAAAGVFKPDCIMLGIRHPAPGALQAIKRIRETHPQVRVVAVSNFQEAGLRRQAADAGASAYVTTENLSELFVLAAPERLTMKPVRRAKSPARKK